MNNQSSGYSQITDWDTVKNTEKDVPYEETFDGVTFRFTSEYNCELITSDNPSYPNHFKK